MNIVMIIVGFIIGIILLLILVTFHEFAHFVVAKLAGAYVYEFSIGFGPKIFSWGKKETKYYIRIFPLGGYVYIASELTDPPKGREDEPVLASRKMENIARWKRLLFIVSGAIMNFFLAVLIFTMAFGISAQKPNDMSYWGATYSHDGVAYQSLTKTQWPTTKPLLNSTLNYDKAVVLGYWIFLPDGNNQDNKEKTELRSFLQDPNYHPSLPGVIFQKLITIDRTTDPNNWKLSNYHSYYSTVTSFIANLKAAYNHDSNNSEVGKSQVCFLYTTLDKYMQMPQANSSPATNFSVYNPTGSYEKFMSRIYLSLPTNVKASGGTYTIGIAPPTRVFTSFGQGYAAGWKEAGTESVTILKSFGSLFTGQWANLTGPVGIAKTMSNIFSQGALSLFLYVAMLSANLFVLNLLPIPPLDGYKFFENIVEGAVYWSKLGWWKMLLLCSQKNETKYQANIFKLNKNWQLPKKWKITVNIIGALIFILLFIGITIKDIFF